LDSYEKRAYFTTQAFRLSGAGENLSLKYFFHHLILFELRLRVTWRGKLRKRPSETLT
jgi:hypothetical protein